MKIIKAEDNLRLKNTIITLGKFDGNHIGHRSLFMRAKAVKDEAAGTLSTVIFTFDINPRQVLTEKTVSNLYTNAERISIEEAYGIDYVYVWPFTKENMSMSPEAFVKTYLSERLGVRHIVVGEDFRFGRARAGGVDTLTALSGEFGFTVHAVPKVTYKGEAVSSTRIKEEILKGNLEDANYMLGSPFSVTGTVVRGKHLGKSLGFPTINFEAPEGKILPPDGVYATKTFVDGTPYISMSNIGTRPTFEDGSARNIETNIFDFDRDIYGKKAKVEFYKFIRPEKHFESADELVSEIERNKIRIRGFFTDDPGI